MLIAHAVCPAPAGRPIVEHAYLHVDGDKAVRIGFHGQF
jgi:hypothetical protein